jgi:hypothetical protein
VFVEDFLTFTFEPGTTLADLGDPIYGARPDQFLGSGDVVPINSQGVVLIGSAFDNPLGRTGAGTVYGLATPISGDVDLGQTGPYLEIIGQQGDFLRAVSPYDWNIGNRDVPDPGISAPGRESTAGSYLILDDSVLDTDAWPRTVDLAANPHVFALGGVTQQDVFQGLFPVGDLNNDGVPDLTAGAPGGDGPATQ